MHTDILHFYVGQLRHIAKKSRAVQSIFITYFTVAT